MATHVAFDALAPRAHAPRAALERAVGLTAEILRLLAEAHVEPAPTPDGLARRATRTARTILHVHGVDVRQAGSLPGGPAIVVANHVSYIDPLVVSAVVPCISIAKGETRGWPLVGRGLRALGVLFVQRGDPYSGAAALRAGATVLNFPEGTTTDGRSLGPFRRGVFGLALLARVPVVPARIDYDDDRVPWFGGQTFAPHYWKLAGAGRIAASVRLAEPLLPGPDDDAESLATRARAIIAAL
jgi:1-acyl-sn-glycerol-3-phosphate acyltransferase